jgi:hypothetical protein
MSPCPFPRLAPALLALSVVVAGGCAELGTGDLSGALDATGLLGPRSSSIAAGLREALEVGARNAVELASKRGGFLDEPQIRIPLPRELNGLTSAMRQFGLAGQVDELEVAMNRAAEEASAEALDVFGDAIRAMTFDDARAILAGSDTAATDYLRRTSTDTLRTRFEPIIDAKIHEVGLARLYGDIMARLRLLPVPLPATPPLPGYVTDRALEGLFTLMGDEERKIRHDPAARVTERLRQVFGGA